MMPRLGPYELVAELGRGGMGVVYQAFDPFIRRSVAIKTLRLFDASPAERALLEDRLAREAQSAGRLSHPNIVTIYQIGSEQTASGVPLAYIVMEYVPGQTLAERLTRHPPLEPAAILDILAQTAEALDYAHSQGVIHRDIKPANLLLTQEGRIKVADFGIAQITSHTVTQAGAIFGSPYYMAPEQIRAEALDGRADQFSLAVVAFEMLSGQRPFTADTASALVYQIAHQETPTALLLRVGLSPATVQVIRTALAKQPAERFATCRQMVAALRDSFQVSFAPLPTPDPAQPPPRRTNGNWARWTAGLAIPLLFAAGLLAWLRWRGNTDTLPLSTAPELPPTLQKSGPRPTVQPQPLRPAPVAPAPTTRTALAVEISEAATALPAQEPPPAPPVSPSESTAPPPPVLPPPAPSPKADPAVLRKVDPVYTEAARRAGIEGVVSLRVRVTPAGIPENIEILQGLEPGLDQRAVEALSQWRFSPATAERGENVPWSGVVQLHFRLFNGPKAAPPSLKKR
ncbi:MAG: TonB family protein [Acidobacteriota bacterium]